MRWVLKSMCLVLTTMFFVVANGKSSDLESVVTHIQAGQTEEAKREIRQLEYNLPDSLKTDLYYLMGVVEEADGNVTDAKKHFEHCVELAEAKSMLDESYIDALARLTNFCSTSGEWNNVVRMTRKAFACPDSLLESYPNTHMFYEWQIHALNSLWKYNAVVSIAQKGMPFWTKQFSPNQKEFYNLYFSQIVALLLMNKWDEAESLINEIDTINTTSGDNVLDYEVSCLRRQLSESMSTMDWRGNSNMKIRSLYETANNFLLSPTSSVEGYEKWKKFFNYIQKQLELCYFDINNPEDEQYWSQLLACAIVYFNTIYEDLPNHTELAYDLILLRKNFLDYHSGLLHKTPRRWQEIRDNLNSDELAIEITMCPNEILILGKDFQSPIAVSIPDDIMEGLETYNKEDAVAINEFYKSDSPLIPLIQLITPYCQYINTLFVSPTNLFAQFNYSIIPFEQGLLEDRFNVVQLTTTADIENYHTKNPAVSVDVAMLYGGIDYDNLSLEKISTPIFESNAIAQEISKYRSGYGYLPYSLNEVNMIAGLLPKSTLITGSDASETRFKNTDWDKEAHIIHLATHGYSLSTTANNEMADSTSRIMSLRLKSGLLMSGANHALKGLVNSTDDGILTSQEIAELDLSNVELAVLSSCSSGMGDLTNTNGVVYGVSNAMKSAGVNHLVVTLWDIPDEVTSIGMKYFYESIISGKSTQESLKLMRKHLINKGYSDPYFWGAFVALD